MRSVAQHRESSRSRRSGVSLIELLVVMAIIAMLAAASLTMLGRTGEAARASQTMTTIRKLDSLLKARFDELVSNFNEQELKQKRENTWLNLLHNTNHANVTAYPQAVRVAVVKSDRYRGLLPQREADLYGLDFASDHPTVGYPATDDSPLLAIWLGNTPVWNNTPIDRTKHTAETESSELLYLALTKGVSSGAGQDVLGSIDPRHIADTDGDGFPEFVDGWGKPLRFYNAPTRLVRPGGVDSIPTKVQHALAASLIADLPGMPSSAAGSPGFYAQSFNLNPLDTRGALHNPALSAAFRADFETNYYTPDTWFKPLIVSCGPDENLGLAEPAPPSTSTNPAYYRLGYIATSDDADAAADNLTNLQAGP